MDSADRHSSAASDARLLSPLPDPIEAGAGTSLLVEGEWPSARPGSMSLALGPVSAPVDAQGMPPSGSLGRGSRWWTLLSIPAGVTGEAALTVRGEVGGSMVEVEIGSTRIVGRDSSFAPPPPSFVTAPAVDPAQPLIAICMATHEPSQASLERQIGSIRAQEWENWVCAISDDASSAAALATLRAVIGDDERFVVSHTDQRLGFCRNFERALRMAPVEAAVIALCDQDDRWYPDKLGTLHATLTANPEALLVYSDMRMVDEDSKVLSETHWVTRRNHFEDMGSLLITNTVTGAALAFRRELLEHALPFPPPIGRPYHDHWLALCALAAGPITYVDRPLYDRVLHGESVTSQANPKHLEGWPRRRRHRGFLRLRMALASARQKSWALPGRSVYFDRYLMLAQFARVLEMRLGDRIEPRKARALRLMIGAESAPRGLLWLAARLPRPWIGHDETLGRERVLLGAVIWRRVAGRRRRRRAATRAAQAS